MVTAVTMTVTVRVDPLMRAVAAARAALDVLAGEVECLASALVPKIPAHDQEPALVSCILGGSGHGRTQDVSGMGGEHVELCLDCGVELRG